MSYLAKAKGLNNHASPLLAETHSTSGMALDDNMRCYLMRRMVEWSERAAMMTCGDLTVEQAEMAAWHDLNLDKVFHGIRRLN